MVRAMNETRRREEWPIEKRFFRYVMIDVPAKCWNWLGCKSPQGYGKTSVAGRAARAHRVSYELHKGPIPEGMMVLHSCDNPSCVNPSHLSVGTAADNAADTVARGRQTRNEEQAERQRSNPYCLKGHLYSEVGILWREMSGKQVRYCRECSRLKSARGNARIRKLAA